MKLNVICGLPRSGSTLFCNLLNQNNKFWATSTSNLPQMLNAISHTWNSVEVKNLLEKQKEETEERMWCSMRSFIEGWHNREGKEVIFDKSRGWSSNNLMLKHLYPNSKIIVFVRDLRNIFSSIGVKRFKDSHVWHPSYKELRLLIKESGFEIKNVVWQKGITNQICYIQAKKMMVLCI